MEDKLQSLMGVLSQMSVAVILEYDAEQTRQGIVFDYDRFKNVGEKDPTYPQLVNLGSNPRGQTTSWVYGPYMILPGNAGFACAGLISVFLHSDAPDDIDPMPVVQLLKEIDRIVGGLVKKGWSPPEYLFKKIERLRKGRDTSEGGKS